MTFLMTSAVIIYAAEPRFRRRGQGPLYTQMIEQGNAITQDEDEDEDEDLILGLRNPTTEIKDQDEDEDEDEDLMVLPNPTTEIKEDNEAVEEDNEDVQEDNPEVEEDDDLKIGDIGGVTKRNIVDLSHGDDDTKVKAEDVDEKYNYITWDRYKIRGKKRNTFKGVEWQAPTVQYWNKKHHIRDKKNKWYCTYCHATFATATNLLSHMVSFHIFDGNKFECLADDCGKTYRQRGGVLQHIKRNHCEDPQFPCGVCGTKHQNNQKAARCCKRQRTGKE